MMIDGWSEMGGKASVPVMLVFAENDSRYTANTIRKSAKAFKDAGGKADLLLLPPQQGDGHFVYHNVKAWASPVAHFVGGLKMGNQLSVAPMAIRSPSPDATTLATENTHPALFDLTRLGDRSEGCRALHQEFLKKNLPRYFAVGKEKKGCAYSSGKDASEAKAVERCQKVFPQCVLYARDNELAEPVSAGGVSSSSR